MNTPPIIPRAPPVIIQNGSTSVFQVTHIAGTENLTFDQLNHEIERGAHFVIFQYCFSVVVLTFKRSSPIVFLPAGVSAFSAGLPYTAISLTCGWWGIPWGPIWTSTAIINNLSGGRDVTREILAKLGIPHPVSIAKSQEPLPVNRAHESRKPLIRGIGWGVGVFVIIGIILLGFWAGHNNSTADGRVGYTTVNSFQEINNRLGPTGSMGGGNSQGTANFAMTTAAELTEYRNLKFANLAQASVFDEHDNIKAYCSFNDDRFAALVYVPAWQRFDSKTKSIIESFAWTSIQYRIFGESEIAPGTKLVVGFRGVGEYDCVLIGSVATNKEDKAYGNFLRIEGTECKQELQKWFFNTASMTNSTSESHLQPK